MYDILRNLLSDKKGGEIFVCFDAFHICFILAFVLIAVAACWYVKNKSKDKKKAIDRCVNIAFALYILDFFLMPFAYEAIDIEKLTFHVCTTMCVMCFLSRYNSFFSKFRLQFAMLGFLSNFTYMIYPAGMMWHQVHPLSYRVVQTLLFHGVMMIYGTLVLVCESEEFQWKKCYKDLMVLVAMVLWALLGNTLYNNDARFYNWFFVVRDPFHMFSETASPYFMPFLNIAIFGAAEVLVYFILSKLRKKKVKSLV